MRRSDFGSNSYLEPRRSASKEPRGADEPRAHEQPEFNLTYKEIYYAGIWASNVNFGSGPNGQDLASIEIDYYACITPTLGKWNFDIAAYYVTYPGAFNPGGEFDYVEIWTGVNRSFFNDRLTLHNL